MSCLLRFVSHDRLAALAVGLQPVYADAMHNGARIVDLIGRRAIRHHFGISDQAISKWRRRGVPAVHHDAIREIATRDGIDLTGLLA